MAFELPQLAYSYDALEPYIDSKTMEIHHSKHHAAYVNNLNAALKGHNDLDKSIEDLLSKISKHSAAVRNNGGGHYNHSLFWSVIAPSGNVGNPAAGLAEALDRSFGSFESFKEEFTKAAMTRFGSGWAWLCASGDELSICSTPNQDNPLMDIEGSSCGTPILGLDVWEHAYYLKYQNKRPDYIAAFFNVINWQEVSKRFSASKKF